MQADEHTLLDLEILSKDEKNPGIINLFVKPRTQGGSDKVMNILVTPKKDVSEINEIQNSLKFILKNISLWETLIDEKLALSVEKYLMSNIIPVSTTNRFKIFWEKYKYRSVYFLLRQSVIDVKTFLFELNSILQKNKGNWMPAILKSFVDFLKDLITSKNTKLLLEANPRKLTKTEVLIYDKIIRGSLKSALEDALHQFYQIDAFISMAKTIRNLGFIFPEFIESDEPKLEIIGLYHSALKKPMPVNISFNANNNFLFLTGANMSGKTTFIKALGIAVYLAHVGMAVPAKSMKLTKFDILMSNINTEDNIRLGYSYFYSEVRRIREIAEQLNKHEKSIILSDELFKGTNIHDAYEASKLVITGFSRFRKSIFVLSTHLTELEAELNNYPNIFCKYFEIEMADGNPRYKYILKDGISRERLGLLILKQERVPELLNL